MGMVPIDHDVVQDFYVKKCFLPCIKTLYFIIGSAAYAFKPKDIRFNTKTLSPDSGGKLTESDIKERIDRLCKTLENKVCFLF